MAATGMTRPKKTTADATAEFFSGVAARRHEPLLGNVSGTLRFDLVDGERLEHWYVTMNRGDVAISHQGTQADSVIQTDKALFNRLVSGAENAMAAALRGALVAQGDLSLLMSFQRLFPGPAAAGADAAAGAEATASGHAAVTR